MEADQGSRSYYSILGVGAHSSDDEIRRAYRKLAMVCMLTTLVNLCIFLFFLNLKRFGDGIRVNLLLCE